MRRSDLLIKIISLIMFVAVVFYIGYYFYSSKTDPLKTVLAVNYSGGESYGTNGYIVRSESVLSADNDNIYITVDEGSKVTANQEIAIDYKNSDAASRSGELRDIELQLEQLNIILDSIKSENTSGDSKIFNSVLDLAETVQNRDFSNLDQTLLEAETYITKKSDGYSEAQIEAEIKSLRSKLDSLKSSSSDMSAITADFSGTFSSYVDGYESISPKDLEGLTPETYKELFASVQDVPEFTFGKLISSIKWYYVTVVNDETASKLDEGASITLEFSRTYTKSLSMKVESIGSGVDGKRTVVFSSDKYIADVASLREVSADIIFKTYSGIRVPKEAVHLDDEGNAFVYLLAGLRAKLVYVDPITDYSDYYIVESLDIASFHEGSEVIVKANDLYDGKVVQ